MGTGAAVFPVNDNQLLAEISLSFRSNQLATVLIHIVSSCEESLLSSVKGSMRRRFLKYI